MKIFISLSSKRFKPMISKRLILKSNLLIIVNFLGSAESLLLWGLSSSCRGQVGRLACRLLTAASSLAAEHRLQGMQASVAVVPRL